MNNDKYLTVQEIANKYKVTSAAVHKWIKEGKLKAIKMGRLWRIPESALQEFIKVSKREKK
jgi:excisionase family DNA binding protein